MGYQVDVPRTYNSPLTSVSKTYGRSKTSKISSFIATWLKHGRHVLFSLANTNQKVKNGYMLDYLVRLNSSNLASWLDKIWPITAEPIARLLVLAWTCILWCYYDVIMMLLWRYSDVIVMFLFIWPSGSTGNSSQRLPNIRAFWYTAYNWPVAVSIPRYIRMKSKIGFLDCMDKGTKGTDKTLIVRRKNINSPSYSYI